MLQHNPGGRQNYQVLRQRLYGRTQYIIEVQGVPINMGNQ